MSALPAHPRPFPLGRREAGLALLGLAGLPGAARAQVAESTTILVPGPEDGGCARWAARAAAALARGLHRPGPLRLSFVGGPDGVTAANRFATLDGAEGPRLLVLPGWTCHARLTGTTRARFEPGAWLPLMASWQGAVLAGRGPRPGRGGTPLRVAIPAPEAPEAAALAALDLLGVPAAPVTGAAEAAFAAGDADALIVIGADPVARAASLGAVPWYLLSTGEGEATEIPPLPGRSPETRAVLAAAAGLQMRAALVMPPLTPADAVAAWRRAAVRWQEEERAQPTEGQPLTGTAAGAAFALLAPAADATLAYRSWLERRLGWRAG
ncbi:hypothetical protein [Roseomonas populi]|uniref:Tripartite tricarboxylate transporter substrate binding protein n=1 Tax=Roseomonas populi TaxID=3121582 RepID=A0ABT1X128_9PROT|nr:hypothetical protein [Roseomonas pecuniae]MCR0980882.1 hypothetical protein [Roseomonas pecuniae]